MADERSRTNLPPKYDDFYPAGTQAKVFFGSVWVDDLVSIQWDAVEQKAPLYGYNSDLFDGVAAGTKIVQGVLTIAFKKAGYIPAILTSLRQRGIGSLDPIGDFKRAKADRRNEQRRLSWRPTVNTTPLTGALEDSVTPGPRTNNIEQLLDLAKQDDNSLYEMIAENLRNSIWGNTRSNPFTVTDHDKSETGLKVVRGFDIFITYGHIEGDQEDFTKKLIENCHITAVRQQFGATGEPIMEGYTFFGKVLDPHLATFNQVFKQADKEDPIKIQDEAEKSEQVRAQVDTYRPDLQTPGTTGGTVVLTVPNGLTEAGWVISDVKPMGVEEHGIVPDFLFDVSPGSKVTVVDINLGPTSPEHYSMGRIVIEYTMVKNGTTSRTLRTGSILIPIKQ